MQARWFPSLSLALLPISHISFPGQLTVLGQRGGSSHRENSWALTVHQSDAVTLVDVEGQLIVGNRQELKGRVLEELDRGRRKFVIDFQDAGYIDSSGLGVLVSLSKKIREHRGELRLSGLSEDLRTLFELTKLDTLFIIADSRDEALRGI